MLLMLDCVSKLHNSKKKKIKNVLCAPVYQPVKRQINYKVGLWQLC